MDKNFFLPTPLPTSFTPPFSHKCNGTEAGHGLVVPLKVRVRGTVHGRELRRHRGDCLADRLRARERHWLVHVTGLGPATWSRIVVLAAVDLGDDRAGHRTVGRRPDDGLLHRSVLVEGYRSRGNRFLEILCD